MLEEIKEIARNTGAGAMCAAERDRRVFVNDKSIKVMVNTPTRLRVVGPRS